MIITVVSSEGMAGMLAVIVQVIFCKSRTRTCKRPRTQSPLTLLA